MFLNFPVPRKEWSVRKEWRNHLKDELDCSWTEWEVPGSILLSGAEWEWSCCGLWKRLWRRSPFGTAHTRKHTCPQPRGWRRATSSVRQPEIRGWSSVSCYHFGESQARTCCSGGHMGKVSRQRSTSEAHPPTSHPDRTRSPPLPISSWAAWCSALLWQIGSSPGYLRSL